MASHTHTRLRQFEKPKKQDYNFEATKYQDILKPDKFIYEPPYTQKFDHLMMGAYARACHKINVPKLKCHAQDTERAVALMHSCIDRACGTEAQNALMNPKNEIASQEWANNEVKI